MGRLCQGFMLSMRSMFKVAGSSLCSQCVFIIVSEGAQILGMARMPACSSPRSGAHACSNEHLDSCR